MVGSVVLILGVIVGEVSKKQNRFKQKHIFRVGQQHCIPEGVAVGIAVGSAVVLLVELNEYIIVIYVILNGNGSQSIEKVDEIEIGSSIKLSHDISVKLLQHVPEPKFVALGSWQ